MLWEPSVHENQSLIAQFGGSFLAIQYSLQSWLGASPATVPEGDV